MFRKLTVLLFTCLPALVSAQEFMCQVSVNAAQVEGSEKKVFQTLQTAVYEFITTASGPITFTGPKNGLNAQ